MSINEESCRNVINFLLKIDSKMSKKEILKIYEKEVFLKDSNLSSLNNYLRVVKRNLFINNKLDKNIKDKNIRKINESVKKLNIDYEYLIKKLKIINKSKKNNLIEKIEF